MVAKKKVVKVKKKPYVLPRKLSSLINIALRDIRKAEAASDKYVIDMDIWYSPGQNLVCKIGESDYGKVVSKKEVCVMCAAGSVLAFTLKAGNNFLGADRPGERANSDQLSSIDYLRQGEVASAASNLGLAVDESEKPGKGQLHISDWKKFDTDIQNYEVSDPEPFHKEMEKLKAKLEKAGL